MHEHNLLVGKTEFDFAGQLAPGCAAADEHDLVGFANLFFAIKVKHLALLERLVAVFFKVWIISACAHDESIELQLLERALDIDDDLSGAKSRK